MSKRVEILNIRLNQLQSEMNELDNRTHKLYMRKQDEQKRMLGSYFSVSDEQFVCQATGDTRVVLRYVTDNYGEIVSYQLNDRWSRDERAERVEDSKIYHNGSTFDTLDQHILDQSQARFEFMQCAVDFNDDIIAAWNTIERKYDKLVASFSEAKSKLRTAINDQSRDIDRLEKETLAERLKNGLEFVKGEDGRYSKGTLPEIEIRWDWTIRRIKSLKVLRMTASGKSADIEVVQKSQRWDDNYSSYKDVEETNTFERVRMNKIESMLRRAKNAGSLV
mgnify:FL=1|jgi:hypothetical protein